METLGVGCPASRIERCGDINDIGRFRLRCSLAIAAC